MRIRFILITLFCVSLFANAQETPKKTLQMVRATEAPKIDGVLDDAVWQNAMEATDFVQFRPNIGIIDSINRKTTVKMTYDDVAIYVSAYLYDNPTLIMKQLTARDNFGQSDFFAVVFNPNNDDQNDTLFFVFASGSQSDAIANPSIGEDFSWNAVWDSAVKIVDDGWIVEMKIPYSMLRFSNQDEPTWGIQFHRHFRRDRSQSSWNPIDPTQGIIGLYHGELKGFKNLQPPLRLNFLPFTSGLVNTFDGKTDTNFTFGMDVKYGITDNFTLDATLVPDFSQAGFDNVELNLGPFEQAFSEQRQFFTEGVDLFSKGNLFFSRRVGNRPTGSVNLNDEEEITNFPNEVKVINAIKISGRTKKGLGLGIFNAITDKTFASIKNNVSNEIRKELVEPLANYNILVVDQQFRGNSSISFINTNVTRSGDFRDANVTAAVASITNKRNTYNLSGEIKMSNINEFSKLTTGFSSFLSARKINGNYRFGIDHSFSDTNYNINDLGLLFRNNFNDVGIDASYRIFKPTKKFNNYSISTFLNYNRLSNPNVYTGNFFGINFNAQTKKLNTFGTNLNFQAGKQFDYFEPRTDGRFFIFENRLRIGAFYSSNYNKTFAYDINLNAGKFFESSRNASDFSFNLSPRFRFNDKFLIVYSFQFNKSFNDRGFVSNVNDDIIFGDRLRKTIVNNLSGSYNFNPNHNLSLTFRNFWSTVTYNDSLFLLLPNGRVNQNSNFLVGDLENNPNINFNTWNLDLNYSWQITPGSFLTVLYRNQLFNNDNQSLSNFNESFDSLLNQPIQHTLSLRLQYFIDYNNIKNVFNKKTTS